MLWAQSAWGSYWSWDPKETMPLLLFLSLSASLVAY
jgi:ABC-type transport system involved in cytochrome c biogenesis permease subunit